jgi:hypothetical protein
MALLNKKNKTLRHVKSTVTSCQILVFYLKNSNFLVFFVKKTIFFDKNTNKKTLFNKASYNRFIELMQNSLMIMIIFLQSKCMGKLTGISFIDSTPICVCNNRRIINHCVFKEVAKRGKISTGYKFGFKLHLVINHLR